jgi:hypothetical protein
MDSSQKVSSKGLAVTESLAVPIGSIRLKNPLIAAPGEHLIESEGVRRALRAGVGAVVVKSTNESEAARDQLKRAEYMALDEHWCPTIWGPSAPASVTIACRSGLHLSRSIDGSTKPRLSIEKREPTTPMPWRA